MYQFIESIQLKNRKLINLQHHTKRFNVTRKNILGESNMLDLNQIISIPETLSNQIYKCRIVYSKDIDSIEWIPYIRKKIHSLKIVENAEINYSYKYLDRTKIDILKINIKEDDVLITKNGNITDTTFSNIIFYDGKKWITPATYLLNGTKRQYLLDEELIVEDFIQIKDLKYFKFAKLINSMLDIDDSELIEIKNIH